MLRLFFCIYGLPSSPGSAVLSHPARHHFQRCFVRPTAAGTDEPALRAALWESSSLKALLWGAKAPVVASSAHSQWCLKELFVQTVGRGQLAIHEKHYHVYAPLKQFLSLSDV